MLYEVITVFGTYPGSGESAGHHFCPVSQISVGVTANSGVASSTGSGVDADNIFERHGEEAIGIILAQIPPAGKWQSSYNFV